MILQAGRRMEYEILMQMARLQYPQLFVFHTGFSSVSIAAQDAMFGNYSLKDGKKQACNLQDAFEWSFD